ncbi:MAG: TauD/TfdA family dioxygenase [Acidimicrobiales bacterium]
MLDLRRLSSAFGVEAVGLDLYAPLTGDTRSTLRAAYRRGHLVLVRGDCVAMETQREFASLFGPVIDSAYVSNARPDGIIRNGALLFHSDLAFTPHPYLGLSLHAIELPASGSSTFFVDAVAAFRALPLVLRDRVQGLTATHAFDLQTQQGDSSAYREPVPAHAERAIHPVVLVHPATGDGVLYVNEMQTERINELERAESDELIAALFAHLYSGEFTYEHRWQVGDLIVWDNVAVQHARRDPGGGTRTLQRVTLAEIDPLASWKSTAARY